MNGLEQPVRIYEAVKKKEILSEWTCGFIYEDNSIKKSSWLWRQRCSSTDGLKEHHRTQGIRVSVGRLDMFK